ncbi:MAG: hypothetical protein M3112_03100, partial [Actinomycetia bacterium]|nr:hypothetical protein [Actinomycetes bacterium]
DPACGICPVSEWCLDPTIYEAPKHQSRFPGSPRQLRGALVRAHLEGTDLHEAGQALNRSAAEISAAINTLRAEGLVAPADSRE